MLNITAVWPAVSIFFTFHFRYRANSHFVYQQ